LKKQGRNILQKCHQLGGLFLVLLFLSITVVQAVHRHNRAVQTEQSSNDEDTVSDSDQCQICDYFTQKQSKHLHLSQELVVFISLPEPISYKREAFIGNYKFTLQGFTNKGPPTILAQVKTPYVL
jgi:hypothetical protein